MKVKIIAVFEFVLILLLLAVLLSQVVSFKRVRPLVREPEEPGASSLSYTPPPPPKVPVEVVKKLADLKKMTTPKVEEVAENIHNASGFALGNVQMVVTEEGLVIIDTTESQDAAREILGRFREITDKPVRFVIYTHGHLDHVYGSPVFMERDTEVIATRAFLRFTERDFQLLKGFHVRSRLNQSGDSSPAFARKLPVKSLFRGWQGDVDFVRPTVTFEESYTFDLGERRFQLFHTTGETPDHLMVWLPGERILFCGDLYYASFPNLSTPMLESRPVQGWYESLDRMIALDPEILVPGHTDPIVGRQQVREVLANHSQAIRHVYEETVRCIYQGKTVEEAVRTVRLPEDLAAKPRLQELYGRVDWSVRGIYRGLTGWYDGRGTGLAPLPSGFSEREVVKLAGGANRILARAVELQKAGEHQLACELCDVVIQANPGDRLAHLIKACSLESLAFTSGNLNMFGFYRSAAALERKAAGRKPD